MRWAAESIKRNIGKGRRIPSAFPGHIIQNRRQGEGLHNGMKALPASEVISKQL